MRAFRILGPAAVFMAVLAIWWAATAFQWVDGLVLPSPIAVAVTFWTEAGTLAFNAGVTATEAVTGLVIGNSLGLLLAILFVGSPTTRRSVGAACPTSGLARCCNSVDWRSCRSP